MNAEKKGFNNFMVLQLSNLRMILAKIVMLHPKCGFCHHLGMAPVPSIAPRSIPTSQKVLEDEAR
jgi:hypothetical protein